MHYILANPKTISEFVRICDTPAKILLWMKLHIRHKEDTGAIRNPHSVFDKREAYTWTLEEFACYVLFYGFQAIDVLAS